MPSVHDIIIYTLCAEGVVLWCYGFNWAIDYVVDRWGIDRG